MRAKAAPMPAEAPVTSASLRSMMPPEPVARNLGPAAWHSRKSGAFAAALSQRRIERGSEWVYRARRVTASGRQWDLSLGSRRYWMADPAVGAAEAPEESHHSPHSEGFYALALGAMGVVFGDIGTSPLYAMREALRHTRATVDPSLAVLGVVSLVTWALVLIVTI